MSLKEYPFKVKEDFIYYIEHLIISTVKNLESYERQINELGRYIEERNLIERPKRVVSAEIYEDYRNMVGFSFGHLANLFGDQAAYGSSYKNYRKNVKKLGRKLGINYVKITQDQEEELNAITTARDWGNHVPVSLIHSTENKAFGNIPNIKKPIYVADFVKYEGMWLVSLYNENYASLNGFKKMFEVMKSDYEKLTGNPCIISKQRYPVRNMDDLIIPKISYGIQTKKIKTIKDIQNAYNDNSNNIKD